MTRRIAGLAFAPALVSCLALGCASQQDEALSRDEVAPAEARESPLDDAAAAPDEPAAEAEPEPLAPAQLEDLDDVERELAANEAKLRALGVQLRAADTRERGGEDQRSDTASPKAEAKDEPKKPRTQGGALPAAPPDTKPKSTKPKGGGGKSTKTKQDAIGLDGDGARPDEAKATPLSPSSQQDAATRCMSICDLSQITCELSAQVCELADHHDDEQDYRSACERAVEDCNDAQEACNACQ